MAAIAPPSRSSDAAMTTEISLSFLSSSSLWGTAGIKSIGWSPTGFESVKYKWYHIINRHYYHAKIPNTCHYFYYGSTWMSHLGCGLQCVSIKHLKYGTCSWESEMLIRKHLTNKLHTMHHNKVLKWGLNYSRPHFPLVASAMSIISLTSSSHPNQLLAFFHITLPSFSSTLFSS